MATSSTTGLSPAGNSGSRFGNYGSNSSCSGDCPSAVKIHLLETQVSSLRQQMSVLGVEMGLAVKWIHNTFGVQIVNAESPYYKIVHGPSFEMLTIQKSLEVTTRTEAPVTYTAPTEELATPTPRRSNIATSTISSDEKESHGRRRATTVGRRCADRDNREKRFQCRHCPVSFSLQCNRTAHERIHTGEKPYSCRHCSVSFRQAGDRTIHERRHTGEKPYSCGQCSAVFTKAGHRASHERTHADHKPFSCQYCDKQFSRGYELGTHIRTHTGEKPYVCQHPSCEETFHSSEALRAHRRKIHSGSN